MSLLELASNKALEHDANTQTRLQNLQGKIVTLHIKDLDRAITVTPQAEGIELTDLAPERSDVTLSITLAAMVKIGRHGLENADLEPGALEMNGDPIVGQRFAQTISELNIDWEELLAEQVGEAPARVAITMAQQAKTFADQSRSQLHTIVKDTITKDMDLVADEKQVDGFMDEVDNLRAHVDRLSTRLNTLLSKAGH